MAARGRGSFWLAAGGAAVLSGEWLRPVSGRMTIAVNGRGICALRAVRGSPTDTVAAIIEMMTRALLSRAT